MKQEYSIPGSQQPTSGSCPKSDEFISLHCLSFRTGLMFSYRLCLCQ